MSFNQLQQIVYFNNIEKIQHNQHFCLICWISRVEIDSLVTCFCLMNLLLCLVVYWQRHLFQSNYLEEITWISKQISQISCLDIESWWNHCSNLKPSKPSRQQFFMIPTFFFRSKSIIRCVFTQHLKHQLLWQL